MSALGPKMTLILQEISCLPFLIRYEVEFQRSHGYKVEFSVEFKYSSSFFSELNLSGTICRTEET